jgi:DNA-binding protein YbaB
MSDQDKLLDDIRNSIQDMQSQMQDTYNALSDTRVVGKSKDGTVEITMLANYTFCDIDFDKKALADGVKEFKWRIREAWKNTTEKIQEATQQKTVELLKGMDVPEEMKSMPSIENQASNQKIEDDEDDI